MTEQEFKDRIKSTVAKWLNIAIENEKQYAKLFKVEEKEKQSEWVALLVQAFDGTENDDRFDFSCEHGEYTVQVSVDAHGYLVCSVLRKGVQQKKTLAEWKEWWKKNNPNMLETAPKPKYDNTNEKGRIRSTW
jgi:hypothetical protein